MIRPGISDRVPNRSVLISDISSLRSRPRAEAIIPTTPLFDGSSQVLRISYFESSPQDCNGAERRNSNVYIVYYPFCAAAGSPAAALFKHVRKSYSCAFCSARRRLTNSASELSASSRGSFTARSEPSP